MPRQKYPVQMKNFRTMLPSRRLSGSPLRGATRDMQGLRPKVVVLALLSCVGLVRAQETDWATVLRVLDGQTIEVEWRGAREIVRYIGVGAPGTARVASSPTSSPRRGPLSMPG